MLRALLYLVPASCLAVVALVLLGPGRATSALGARVRGAPVAGVEELALRVGTVDRRFGAEDPAPGPLQVEARSGGIVATWEGTTDGDALAEVVLRAPGGFGPEAALTVRRGALVLAEGALRLDAKKPTFAQENRPGVTRGELLVTVRVVRGELAAPFPSAVRLTVSAADVPVPGARVEIRAEGADVAPAAASTGADGAVTLTLTPRFGDVVLSIDAKGPDGDPREGAFESPLRVVPGAMTVSREGTSLRVRSPAPRRAAYLSFFGANGRIGGITVPLVDGANAPSEGIVDGAKVPSAIPLAVLVASDPTESGLGTVAWPLAPDEGQPDLPRLAMLLDGVPGAELREEARARGVRRGTAAGLALGLVLELLLLARVSRDASREVAQLNAAMEAEGSETPPAKPLPTTALFAVVALAFVAMIGFLLVR